MESITDAREYLLRHRPDIVLAAQRTMDGSAFDLLQLLDGVPAIIIVRMGAETHAAQAMRHGFDDFTVQDPGLDYLLTLPAQIEAVLESSSSARARRAADPAIVHTAAVGGELRENGGVRRRSRSGERGGQHRR